jgi:hypothetical protein
MTTYVIKYKDSPGGPAGGPINVYNLGSGFEATLEEATQYTNWHEAKEKCGELCGVEGVYEYEVELSRLKLSQPQPNFITREQLIGAIQEATDVYSYYDDEGHVTRTVTYVDANLLIKAIQELS